MWNTFSLIFQRNRALGSIRSVHLAWGTKGMFILGLFLLSRCAMCPVIHMHTFVGMKNKFAQANTQRAHTQVGTQRLKLHRWQARVAVPLTNNDKWMQNVKSLLGYKTGKRLHQVTLWDGFALLLHSWWVWLMLMPYVKIKKYIWCACDMLQCRGERSSGKNTTFED